MFTRFQRFYNSIKLVADLVAVAFAFALSFYVRFTFFPHESVPPMNETLETLALVLVIFPVVFRGSNLYTTNRGRTHIQEVFEVFKATALSTLVLVGVSYFIRERYSRLTILLFAGFAFTALSVVRLSFRALFNELRRRGQAREDRPAGARRADHRALQRARRGARARAGGPGDPRAADRRAGAAA